MTKRFFFLITLSSITLSSCYKKLYNAGKAENVLLKINYDSLKIENSKKEASIHTLRFKNDSLVKDNLTLDKQTTEFRIKYVHLPTGAKLSTNAAKTSAKLYNSVRATSIPNVFLYNPVNLSSWGNLTYGDCVTAEEAFAKACNNPEIFLPDDVAIGWASENNVLNGANITDVLSKMNGIGFRSNGMTYNDGSYSYVDFTNNSILQNAILTGPVKIGLTSTQLEMAWRYIRRGWFAVNFATEQITPNNQHCATLCGYGTLSWLAQQFNMQLPYGVNGQTLGYAIFTWGSIGIIDQKSLLAITHEAWVRNPTTIMNNNVTSFILKAMGGEVNSNNYLSHASNDTKLLSFGGLGEMWVCHDLGGGKIKLQGRSHEGEYYLSHAHKDLKMRKSYNGGSGEEWMVHNLPNGQIALEALGDERGKFLSHAEGNLNLSKYMLGGEAWLNIGQH